MDDIVGLWGGPNRRHRAANCDLAQTLAARVDREPALQRLAPVALNIVCFRYVAADGDLDRLNANIVADLQEAGIAAPSTTVVSGSLAIRAAIVNHRTTHADIAILVDAVLESGQRRDSRRRGEIVRRARRCPRLFHRGPVHPEASLKFGPNPRDADRSSNSIKV